MSLTDQWHNFLGGIGAAAALAGIAWTGYRLFGKKPEVPHRAAPEPQARSTPMTQPPRTDAPLLKTEVQQPPGHRTGPPDLKNEPTDEFELPVSLRKKFDKMIRENPDIFKQPKP